MTAFVEVRAQPQHATAPFGISTPPVSLLSGRQACPQWWTPLHPPPQSHPIAFSTSSFFSASPRTRMAIMPSISDLHAPRLPLSQHLSMLSEASATLEC